MSKSFIFSTVLVAVMLSSVNSQAQDALAGVAPKKEYSVKLSENTITVLRGAYKSVVVQLNRSRSFQKYKADAEAFGKLPKGVTLSFEPEQNVLDSTVLTVSVGSEVPAGEYLITVSGKMHAMSKSTLLKLIVK
jgi:hypothetical protein